ncbi:hypothetical protein ACFR9U_04560 [Halorientalis brevis]|uniref:Uncharacterized protein n=1 Tax=Halorientalis brevis TaxID=1126241 RepID=A0ABD6CAE0_9EURY|nr:hypothetical protein [Halorientalis brevis]
MPYIGLLQHITFHLILFVFLLGIQHSIARYFFDISVFSVPWAFCDLIGLTRGSYQFLKVTTTFVLYLVIIWVLVIMGTEPVIIGSFLGALPPLLFELNKEWSNPYVVLEDLRLVKYPEQWWVFGGGRDDKTATNSVGVHAVVKNEGRGTAENCTVHVKSDLVGDQRYHTRWADKNKISKNLSPGERQKVDLLWVDLRDESVSTAIPEIGDDEEHYPPGEYNKQIRPELSSSRHCLKSVVSASNMAKQEFNIRLGEEDRLSIPEDIIERATDWDVIKSLKNNPNEDYVILYNEMGHRILEVPSGIDISYLNRIEGFSEEDLDKQPTETYSDALERVYYEIREV